MPTVKEIVTSVREYCGNPSYDKLNLATICLHLYDQIDHLLNRLNLTEENWILGRKIIGVGGDNAEYSLPDNFGRAIVVETVDDGSVDYIRREVQIVSYQDFNLYWSGFTRSVLYDGYSHTAEVCAFYGLETASTRQIQFAPPPQVSADYRVWYEIGRTAPPALSQKPVLMGQFHNLLKVDTAISCLPHCGYTGDQDSTYQQHQGMLQWNHERFDAVFENYIMQNHHEDTGPRRAFNSSRRGGY